MSQFYFPEHDPTRIGDLMSEATSHLVKAECERIESEALFFIGCGYDPRKLTVVVYPDGHREVHPIDPNDPGAVL